jgi:hypothetical protein
MFMSKICLGVFRQIILSDSRKSQKLVTSMNEFSSFFKVKHVDMLWLLMVMLSFFFHPKQTVALAPGIPSVDQTDYFGAAPPEPSVA